MNNLQLYNADNLEVMATLPDESIDVICIDPPYLYLKNQKLERPFDEHKFFAECKRLLTKKGFIVMFGRGTSFYRWNTILDGLGFVFKEEVIWNKGFSTAPTLPIQRFHETIAIYTKEKGSINADVKVPYLEVKQHNIDTLVGDINRIKSALNNTKELDFMKEYLRTGHINVSKKRNDKGSGCTISKNSISVFSIPTMCLKAIKEGMRESSIIKVYYERFNRIHPTQKPVRLLERLLALVIPKDKPRNEIVVADFFAGSMSCMEAVHNMGMRGIATEIDEEYFEKGKQRIESLQPLIINH